MNPDCTNGGGARARIRPALKGAGAPPAPSKGGGAAAAAAAAVSFRLLVVAVVSTWILAWSSAFLLFVAIFPRPDAECPSAVVAFREGLPPAPAANHNRPNATVSTAGDTPTFVAGTATVSPPLNCSFCKDGRSDVGGGGAPSGRGGACTALVPSVLWDHIRTDDVTVDMIRRTRKNVGNVGRLRRGFLRKLCAGEPTNVLIVGGSNCRGSQIKIKGAPRFPELIEEWLNRAFPVAAAEADGRGGPRRHRVHNRGSGGSGACVFSAGLEDFLGVAHPDDVDLVLTEFAINDGLDQSFYLDERNRTSFTTLHRPSNSPLHTPSRLCFESLIRTALAHRPNLAVVSLELANLLTMYNGVAAHHDVASFYGLPVLSWRDAVLPDMRSRLGPKFAALPGGHDPSAEDARLRMLSTNSKDAGFGTPALWVDGKHINLWGHNLVLDAFVNLVREEMRYGSEDVEPYLPPDEWHPYETTDWDADDADRERRGRPAKAEGAEERRKHGGRERASPLRYGTVRNNTVSGPIERVEAQGGAFYVSSAAGRECPIGLTVDLSHWTYALYRKEQHEKVLRYKTSEQAERMCAFRPIERTAGFAYYADRAEKRGWIANDDDRDSGGGGGAESQSITFEVPLPRLSDHPEVHFGHFSIRVGYLRSYEGMGRFEVSTVGELSSGGESAAAADVKKLDLDGLWDRPRSTGEEAEVATATGSVNVTVVTRPDAKREGNKVKLLWIRAVGIR